jgi:hypothetical protein
VTCECAACRMDELKDGRALTHLSVVAILHYRLIWRARVKCAATRLPRMPVCGG